MSDRESEKREVKIAEQNREGTKQVQALTLLLTSSYSPEPSLYS